MKVKESAGFVWITRIVGTVLISLLALPSYAQLMLAHEGHHDAGGCVIKTGEFPVTFSAYEVPEGDIPPMHSFCENVPGVGKVNLTVELMDRDSREIPLAVRLVKVGHEGHGDGHTKETSKAAAVSQEKENKQEDHNAHDMDEHEGHDMEDEHAEHNSSNSKTEHGVVYMPPQKHNSGIIVVSATIEEKGQYEVLLEKQDDAGNVNTVVRIPISFGKGGHGGHGGGFGMMEILLLAVVAGGGVFYYMRRKKANEAADQS